MFPTCPLRLPPQSRRSCLHAARPRPPIRKSFGTALVVEAAQIILHMFVHHRYIIGTSSIHHRYIIDTSSSIHHHRYMIENSPPHSQQLRRCPHPQIALIGICPPHGQLDQSVRLVAAGHRWAERPACHYWPGGALPPAPHQPPAHLQGQPHHRVLLQGAADGLGRPHWLCSLSV